MATRVWRTRECNQKRHCCCWCHCHFFGLAHEQRTPNANFIQNTPKCLGAGIGSCLKLQFEVFLQPFQHPFCHYASAFRALPSLRIALDITCRAKNGSKIFTALQYCHKDKIRVPTWLFCSILAHLLVKKKKITNRGKSFTPAVYSEDISRTYNHAFKFLHPIL